MSYCQGCADRDARIAESESEVAQADTRAARWSNEAAMREEERDRLAAEVVRLREALALAAEFGASIVTKNEAALVNLRERICERIAWQYRHETRWVRGYLANIIADIRAAVPLHEPEREE